MSVRSIAEKAIEQGKGILRLAPNWVPRSFCVPGRRIKLHPADYYALGGDRGGIDERWFSSTTPADNGPKTSPNEGLSFIVVEDGARTEKVTAARRGRVRLKGADHRRAPLERVPRLAHVLQVLRQQGAAPAPRPSPRRNTRSSWAKWASPKSYFFPVQLNNYGADFPYTFFGLQPGRHQRPAARVPAGTSTKATTRSPTCPPPTGWNREPAGTCQAGNPARSGKPVHLRAAEGLRRVRDVSVADRRRHHPRGASVEEHPEGQGRRHRLPDRGRWTGRPTWIPTSPANHFMRPRPVRLVGADATLRATRRTGLPTTPRTTAPRSSPSSQGRPSRSRTAAPTACILLAGSRKDGRRGISTPLRSSASASSRMDEFFITEDAARAGGGDLQSLADRPDRHAQALWTGEPGPEEVTKTRGRAPSWGQKSKVASRYI